MVFSGEILLSYLPYNGCFEVLLNVTPETSEWQYLLPAFVLAWTI